MKILNKNQIILLVILLILYNTLSVSAQNIAKGLIISEVYMDDVQPFENWIEVYNPTDKPLILDRFRISHIRTINVLPADIRKSGGICVEPDKYLILCTDIEQFKAIWGKQIEAVAVEAFAQLVEGGFIAIITKNLGEKDSDGFRYGNPSQSSQVKNQFGAQVLSILKNGKSYSRNIEKMADSVSILDWYESFPTPGSLNELKNVSINKEMERR